MIYGSNPLHVEVVQTLVPFAHEVRIDVTGEPVIDPKRDSFQSNESTETNERNEIKKTYCENTIEYAYFAFLILLVIGLFGGFILFLVWITNPELFGTDPSDY
jgi:hypothetical protein